MRTEAAQLEVEQMLEYHLHTQMHFVEEVDSNQFVLLQAVEVDNSLFVVLLAEERSHIDTAAEDTPRCHFAAGEEQKHSHHTDYSWAVVDTLEAELDHQCQDMEEELQRRKLCQLE